jgi:hypothetical protein
LQSLLFDCVILNGLQAVKDLARVGKSSIYRLIHVLPFRSQVSPVRVHAFDQGDLLAAPASL